MKTGFIVLLLFVVCTAFAQVDNPFPGQSNWKLKTLLITVDTDVTQVAFVMGDTLGVEAQMDTLYIFTDTASGVVTAHDHPQGCIAQIDGNAPIETCDPPTSDWDIIQALRRRFGR